MLAFSRVLSRNLPILKNTRTFLPLLHTRNKSDNGSLSERDRKRMDHIFLQANRHVYKKLTRAEFNYFISLTIGRKVDELDLRELFNLLDVNKDDYIGKLEIEQHLKQGLHQPTKQKLLYAFCRFDKDGDERLYLHEFREALFYLGFIHAGDRKIAEFFQNKDTDNDRRINYDEFTKIIKEDMPPLGV